MPVTRCSGSFALLALIGCALLSEVAAVALEGDALINAQFERAGGPAADEQRLAHFAAPARSMAFTTDLREDDFEDPQLNMALVKNTTRSLVEACRRDVLTLCKQRSVNSIATLDCLTANEAVIDPTCAYWHRARVRCDEQIHRAQNCESCAQVCPPTRTLQNCMRSLGLRRLERVVDYRCWNTPFFRSVMHHYLANSQLRQAKPPF